MYQRMAQDLQMLKGKHLL